MIAKKHYYIFLISLSIFVPPILFYWMFFRYTTNIPINDDYKAILDFLNKCVETDSYKEKLLLIFSQHNEHRIVYDRIWTILIYKIFGQVNFNYLSLIGNLSLFGYFIIYAKKIREINRNYLYLIPLSVLIFNISFNENMTFAMATLSNTTGLFFSILSLYFITKTKISKKGFILSLIFLFLSVFTQGSGLFLIPILFLILLYRKQKKFLIYFLIFIILILLVYFTGYEKPLNSSSILDSILFFKSKSVLFAFAFLGNGFNYYLIFTNELNDSIIFTSIIGFILFTIYLYSIKTKYYQRNLFAFSMMTLFVVTAFLTGFTRSQLGIETAGSSRYRINGVMFFLSLYIFFVETKMPKIKRKEILIIGFSLLYFINFNLRQYEYLHYREKQVYLGLINYKSGVLDKLYGFEQDFYNKTIIESEKNEIYFFPRYKSLEFYFPYSKKIKNSKQFVVDPDLNYNIESITKIKDGYLIEGWAFISSKSTRNQEVYLGIKNKNSEVIYTTKQEKRFDLNPYFKKFNLKNGGFMARIKDSELQKGDNKITIYLSNNIYNFKKETNKNIIK